jgi:LysR family nitrogen assimilation transcriptional regulator
MDRKKLLYFAAIAECGSFTRAAAQLRIAQPALSRQIALLEQEFGVDLFTRMGRHVRLTDAGEVLLRHAHSINKAFDLAREEMQTRASLPRGRVIVGAPPSLSSMLVPRLLSRLRHELPDVLLKVREGTSLFLERSIVEADLDLALVAEEFSGPGVDRRRLGHEDLALVGRPEVLQRVIEAGARWWRSTPLFVTHQVNCILGPILPEHFGEVYSVEMDAIHAIKEMTIQGRGVAISPVGFFWSEIQAGQAAVARIGKTKITRPIILASSASRPHSRAVDATAHVIREEVEQLFDSGAFLARQLGGSAEIYLPIRAAEALPD